MPKVNREKELCSNCKLPLYRHYYLQNSAYAGLGALFAVKDKTDLHRFTESEEDSFFTNYYGEC